MTVFTSNPLPRYSHILLYFKSGVVYKWEKFVPENTAQVHPSYVQSSFSELCVHALRVFFNKNENSCLFITKPTLQIFLEFILRWSIIHYKAAPLTQKILHIIWITISQSPPMTLHMHSSKAKLAINYLVFVIRITNLWQTTVTLHYLIRVILLTHNKRILRSQFIHIHILRNP